MMMNWRKNSRWSSGFLATLRSHSGKLIEGLVELHLKDLLLVIVSSAKQSALRINDAKFAKASVDVGGFVHRIIP
jgi:hypothetical protein